MSKFNHLFVPKRQSYQQGQVSLQNIFWVVGIVVGLLSIAQFVLTQLDKNPDGTTQVSADTQTTQGPQGNDAVEDPVEEPVKTTLFDSPSIKIDNYTAYDNGIVVDDDLGIMWMRCSLGQQWDGSDCTGKANTYTLEEAYKAIDQLNTASYVGLYGWQLPDVESMHSLIYCSEGYLDSYDIVVDSDESDSSQSTRTVKSLDVDCAGNYTMPAINTDAFPNTQASVWRGYWTSSHNVEGKPLSVHYYTGIIKAKNKPQYVRVMRYLD